MVMNKKGLFGFLLALVSSQAAATLMLSPADCNVGVNCWTTNVNSTLTTTEVMSLIGTGTVLTQLYKQDVGAGTDTGPFAASYMTSFSNTATDPEDALISYVGGDAIACPECYLLVKDGNQTPAQYIFDIGAWDGIMDIDLTGFWPNQGAISHVALYGTGRSTEVPEPATLALLGIGLLGLGIRRFK